MKTRMSRCYSELKKLDSFIERFEYLKLSSKVGEETFGFDRYMNQLFYRSPEWKKARDEVIIRDMGMDLGVDGYEIVGRLIVHHMNPISLEDIESRSSVIFNPEYLISVSFDTHNAIHFGDENLLSYKTPIVRSPNDTCPWKN